MADSLDHRIRQRANYACEYCCTPQSAFRARFPFDHVIARQHGGPTTFENLALCCSRCNLYKGPNIAGVDSDTGRITPLFNPRVQKWAEHFSWRAEFIIGLTPEGRATVNVLKLDHPAQLAVRRQLFKEGKIGPLPP